MTDPPETEGNTVVSKDTLEREEFSFSGIDYRPCDNIKDAPPALLPETRNDSMSVITFHTHEERDICIGDDPSLLPSVGGSDLSMNEDDVRHQLRQLEYQFSQMDSVEHSPSSSSMFEYQYSPTEAEHSPSSNSRWGGGNPSSCLSVGGGLATISEIPTFTPIPTVHYNEEDNYSSRQNYAQQELSTTMPLSHAAVARRRRYKLALMARDKPLTMQSSSSLFSIE
mmetsp:Transcript_25552/g.41911  ORF Transcript_25552/g.41911 Transcript_25552/m.41911 type:complete len:225 (+) Transcript_25552:3-677(+)